MTIKTSGTLFLAIALSVASCTSVQKGSNQMKSAAVEPAPDAGFIEHPELHARREDLPFQKVWAKPGFDLSAYRELVVSPVNTQYMMEMDWLHQASSASWFGDVKKDIKELARYFHHQVVKEFEKDPQHRFKVIHNPEDHKDPALRLELALIEIDPSTPVLHALSWAGPIGAGSAVGALNQRRVAFEGRLRDLQTSEVIATFADRDMADVGPLDLTRLTWYGPAKDIMDRWGKQFVQIANRKPGETVSDPTPFTLKPF